MKHKSSAWRRMLCSFNSLYVVLRSRQAFLIGGEGAAHRDSLMNLQAMLKSLSVENLNLKPKKCEFFRTEM